MLIIHIHPNNIINNNHNSEINLITILKYKIAQVEKIRKNNFEILSF